jgi:voltage-gated potassium channel
MDGTGSRAASPPHQTVRERVAVMLDVPQPGDRVSLWIDRFLIGLILFNVIAVVLESVAALQARWGAAFHLIEVFSVSVFTVEYLLRVWSIVDNRRRSEYRHPVRGRLRFMRSPMAVIDLIAVLPFWLSMFITLDLRFLRLARLLRVLKLTRYSAATNLLFEVLREEARVMGAAVFMLFLLLMLMASATYYAENAAQPEAFANIPQAMWWAVITVTTVGYGDVVPITPLGKLFGAALGVVGVGMVALPAGILASGFSNALSRRQRDLRRDVEAALADDGLIDAEERQRLAWRGQSLSLSETSVADIIASESKHQTCPHCGKPLS